MVYRNGVTISGGPTTIATLNANPGNYVAYATVQVLPPSPHTAATLVSCDLDATGLTGVPAAGIDGASAQVGSHSDGLADNGNFFTGDQAAASLAMTITFEAGEGGTTPVTLRCDPGSGTAQVAIARIVAIKVDQVQATAVSG
jgi:hypothetical protein